MSKLRGSSCVESLVCLALMIIGTGIVSALWYFFKPQEPVTYQRTIIVTDTIIGSTGLIADNDYIIRAKQDDDYVVYHTEEKVWGQLQKGETYTVEVKNDTILSIKRDKSNAEN